MDARAECLLIALTRDDLRAVPPAAHVLPLRPDLYLEALEQMGVSRVVDLADLLTLRDRRRARAWGVRLIRGLRSAVYGDRRRPWLAGLNLHYANSALRFAMLAECILERSLVRYGRIQVPCCQETSPQWDARYLHLLHAAFELAASRCVRSDQARISMGGAPVPLRGSLREILRNVMLAAKAGLGGLLTAALPWCPWLARQGRPAPDVDLSGVEVVLAGVQITEVVWQVPLARLLTERYGDRFLWATMKPTARLEAGEQRVMEGRARSTREIAVESLPTWTWRAWPLLALGFVYAGWCAAAHLRRHRCWRGGVRTVDLCRFFVRIGAVEPVMSSRTWDWLLDRTRARVILGSSDIFDMVFFAVWARQHAVPFVQLTHGVWWDSVDFMTYTFGDAVLLHGAYWRELFLRDPTAAGRTAIECGAMFLQDEIASADAGRPADRDPVSVLAMETQHPANPVFASPAERVAWYEDLGRACAALGFQLVIRPHPREGGGDFYERLAARLREAGIRCTVDRGTPLVDSVRRSVATVGRMFENACAKVLLLDRPLLCYIPRAIWPPSEVTMHRVALVSRSVEELTRQLKSLADDPTYLARRLEQQRKICDQVVGRMDGRGWTAVVDAVDGFVGPTRATAAKNADA